MSQHEEAEGLRVPVVRVVEPVSVVSFLTSRWLVVVVMIVLEPGSGVIRI
jgi:hypothetical protein